MRSAPSCSSCAFESPCGAEGSLWPPQSIALTRHCPKTNLQFTLSKQVWCESWEEHSSRAGLRGWRNGTDLCTAQPQSTTCPSNTASAGLEVHSLMALPSTSEQRGTCFQSAELSLALLLFLLGMGQTQNPLKTGVFHIWAFESDPRGWILSRISYPRRTEINRDLCRFLIYVAPLGECTPVTGKLIFYTFQSEALFRHVSKLSQVLRIKDEPQVFSQGWKGLLAWGMLKRRLP